MHEQEEQSDDRGEMTGKQGVERADRAMIFRAGGTI